MTAILFLAWVIIENSYFGWHWWPQSDGELMADGIGFLLCAVIAGQKRG